MSNYLPSDCKYWDRRLKKMISYEEYLTFSSYDRMTSIDVIPPIGKFDKKHNQIFVNDVIRINDKYCIAVRDHMFAIQIKVNRNPRDARGMCWNYVKIGCFALPELILWDSISSEQIELLGNIRELNTLMV